MKVSSCSKHNEGSSLKKSQEALIEQSPLTKEMSLKANDWSHSCLLSERRNLYHRVSGSALLGALRKVRLHKGPLVTTESTLNAERKWLWRRGGGSHRDRDGSGGRWERLGAF